MPRAEQDWGRFQLTAGKIIAPLVTVALLIVFWRLNQKWIIAPAAVFLVFYYLILPRLVRARARRFHREALRLLTSGKAADVPGLAKRNLLLQLFGPSAPIDAKLGLAYAQLGEWAAALPCLDNAAPDAPPAERPALRSALVKALLVTGDPARAEAEARALLQTGVRLPETLVLAARARIGLGKIDDRTAALLDEAGELDPPDDVRLMLELARIEAALATGRKTGDIPAGADSEQRLLRVWIHLVRGRLREQRGNADGAVESYARAVKEGKPERCWFADLAHERLERLGRSVEPSGTTDTGGPRDPAVRRKRKKRR
jgi:tetratricopeptide (TPR) repeat protein